MTGASLLLALTELVLDADVVCSHSASCPVRQQPPATTDKSDAHSNQNALPPVPLPPSDIELTDRPGNAPTPSPSNAEAPLKDRELGRPLMLGNAAFSDLWLAEYILHSVTHPLLTLLLTMSASQAPPAINLGPGAAVRDAICRPSAATSRPLDQRPRRVHDPYPVRSSYNNTDPQTDSRIVWFPRLVSS